MSSADSGDRGSRTSGSGPATYAGSLSASDDLRALSVIETAAPRSSRRRYRCGTCGLVWPANELNPEFDDDGRRVGWICESCY